MEKQLFQVVLPLEEMAYRRVVACLLTNILNSNWNLRYDLDLVENMVKGKAYFANLLPPTLSDRMMPLIRPMASEILNWHIYHENNFRKIREYFSEDSLKYLQWTCKGTIDYPKTMEKLIDLNLFDDEQRYKLACLYCLIDCIPLPLPEHVSFYPPKTMLKLYWLKVLKKENYKLTFIYENHPPNMSHFFQYVFKLSAMQGNKAATRYFFQLLSEEEREPSLLSTISAVLNQWNLSYTERQHSDFSKENISDVLCYLLSLLSPEQQMQALKTDPCNILTCFQDWPLKDLFLEVSGVIWTFLNEENYANLLSNLHKRIQTSNYFCTNLFQKFFVQSPYNFKKEFVDKECQFGYFFPVFFRIQDSVTIKIIFSNIEIPEKKKLVFGECFFNLCCESIFSHKLKMVKVCLQESMLLKRDRQRLKKKFFKFIEDINKMYGAEIVTHKQQEFHEFFEETFVTADEKLDGVTPVKVKKLRSRK